MPFVFLTFRSIPKFFDLEDHNDYFFQTLKKLNSFESNNPIINIIETRKANGANCQMSFSKTHQCWIFGSKSVTLPVVDDESLFLQYKIPNVSALIPETYVGHKRFSYVLEMGRILLHKLRSMNPVQRSLLRDFLARGFTLVGEALGLSSLREHLINEEEKQKESILFFSLIKHDNWWNSGGETFESLIKICKLVGLDHVQIHNIRKDVKLTDVKATLAELTADIRQRSIEDGGEGSVLRLETEDQVAGMFKVKTLEYKWLRKLRERSKILMHSEDIKKLRSDLIAMEGGERLLDRLEAFIGVLADCLRDCPEKEGLPSPMLKNFRSALDDKFLSIWNGELNKNDILNVTETQTNSCIFNKNPILIFFAPTLSIPRGLLPIETEFSTCPNPSALQSTCLLSTPDVLVSPLRTFAVSEQKSGAHHRSRANFLDREIPQMVCAMKKWISQHQQSSERKIIFKPIIHVHDLEAQISILESTTHVSTLQEILNISATSTSTNCDPAKSYVPIPYEGAEVGVLNRYCGLINLQRKQLERITLWTAAFQQLLVESPGLFILEPLTLDETGTFASASLPPPLLAVPPSVSRLPSLEIDVVQPVSLVGMGKSTFFSFLMSQLANQAEYAEFDETLPVSSEGLHAWMAITLRNGERILQDDPFSSNPWDAVIYVSSDQCNSNRGKYLDCMAKAFTWVISTFRSHSNLLSLQRQNSFFLPKILLLCDKNSELTSYSIHMDFTRDTLDKLINTQTSRFRSVVLCLNPDSAVTKFNSVARTLNWDFPWSAESILRIALRLLVRNGHSTLSGPHTLNVLLAFLRSYYGANLHDSAGVRRSLKPENGRKLKFFASQRVDGVIHLPSPLPCEAKQFDSVFVRQFISMFLKLSFAKNSVPNELLACLSDYLPPSQTNKEASDIFSVNSFSICTNSDNKKCNFSLKTPSDTHPFSLTLSHLISTCSELLDSAALAECEPSTSQTSVLPKPPRPSPRPLFLSLELSSQGKYIMQQVRTLLQSVELDSSATLPDSIRNIIQESFTWKLVANPHITCHFLAKHKWKDNRFETHPQLNDVLDKFEKLQLSKSRINSARASQLILSDSGLLILTQLSATLPKNVAHYSLFSDLFAKDQIPHVTLRLGKKARAVDSLELCRVVRKQAEINSEDDNCRKYLDKNGINITCRRLEWLEKNLMHHIVVLDFSVNIEMEDLNFHVTYQ